jgi:hypothetical protein
MRRHSSSLVSSSRLAVAFGGFLVGICAIPAMAAEPGAVAPAPGSTTSSTQVSAPAGSPVVVVHNTTAPAPVVAAAPAPVVAVGPAPDPSWGVAAAAPAAAPAPVVVAAPRIAVDLHPQPMAAPSPAQLEHSRRLAELSRARNLRIGGWVTLGGSYALSALVGTIAIDVSRTDRVRHYGYWMTVPVAGPFGAAFQTRSATGALFTTSLGVAQAVGLGMAIAGGVRHRRLKREISFAAMPGRGGGQVGMTMRF